MKYHGDALYEVMSNVSTVAKNLGMDKLEKSDWAKTLMEEVKKKKPENAEFALTYVQETLGLENNTKVVVESRPMESRRMGECLANAVLEFGATGNRIVAGYCLAYPYGDVNSVFWHFWNQDKNGKHYDTTNIGAGFLTGFQMEWTHRQVVDFIRNNRSLHDPHDWMIMKLGENTYASLKKPWGATKGNYNFVEVAGALHVNDE
jgi:hypothetical protein